MARLAARGIRFCRTFLHVARVRTPTAMRESHVTQIIYFGPLPTGLGVSPAGAVGCGRSRSRFRPAGSGVPARPPLLASGRIHSGRIHSVGCGVRAAAVGHGSGRPGWHNAGPLVEDGANQQSRASQRLTGRRLSRPSVSRRRQMLTGRWLRRLSA